MHPSVHQEPFAESFCHPREHRRLWTKKEENCAKSLVLVTFSLLFGKPPVGRHGHYLENLVIFHAVPDWYQTFPGTKWSAKTYGFNPFLWLLEAIWILCRSENTGWGQECIETCHSNKGCDKGTGRWLGMTPN